MGSGNWTSYIVGAVVGIIVGIFTFGIGFAAYAGTAGVLAFSVTTSYMLSQQAQKGGETSGIKSAAAKELQITTTSESIAVPVVFGTVRLSGNLIRYDIASFSSEGIYDTVEQSSGGKGGGGGKKKKQRVLTGYNYYLAYNVGFCMGPIDALGRFWDANSLTVCGSGSDNWDNDGLPDDPFAETYQGNGASDDEFNIGMRWHRGNGVQIARGYYAPDGVGQNYRHVTWAAVYGKIGKSPVPRTLMVEITRWPKCVDSAGEPVPGLRTQGSLTDTGPSWIDANPAAVLWEIFTNPIWGRGMSPDLLDAESFISCSEYFAQNDIGISFALEEQDVISSTVDFIRQHVATVVVWDGAKMFCRCMMNTAAFKVAASISADQVSKVQFMRPAWPDVPNELRVEFTNRESGYKAEISSVQDDAAITVLGGVINSQRVSMPGFHRRELAEAQASRILAEMAYPAATLVFYMNRWAGHILPGDLVEFVWNEWSDGPITSYWSVAEINDNEQSADGIRVTLQENPYVTAYKGLPQPIEPSAPGWTGDTFNTSEDLALGEDAQGPIPITDQSPLTAWEMPASMAGGSNWLIFTAEKGSPAVQSLAHYWTPDGLTEYQYLGSTIGWAITGTLASAVPYTGRTNCRDATDAFTLSLTNVANEGEILGNANKVLLTSDHLMTLAAEETDILLVGREIMQLGKVTETSPGVYTVENYLRGVQGSETQDHAPGTPFAYLPAWLWAQYQLEAEGIPEGVIDWQTFPTTMKGQQTPGWFHSSTMDYRGSTPYAPSYLTGSAVGLSYTGTFRPRWMIGGAQFNSLLTIDVGDFMRNIPEGMSWVCQPMAGLGTNGDFMPVPVVFAPDDGSTPQAGICTFALTAPAGTTSLRIYSMYKGRRSLQYITITP